MNRHTALLRTASLLVPAARRKDWLAEWQGELWHVGQSRTAFCLGAFKDAFWLRRNDPSPEGFTPFVESPVRCLLLLAILGAVCFAVAPRSELLHALPIAAICCLFTAISGGFPRAHPRRIGIRRALFLAAKILLFLPIVVFTALALRSFGVGVFGSLFGLRWILADQRRRCPVCLRLMTNPVRIGESSHILLEWHGTEMMCPRGHGLLYSPEWPAIWSPRQSWMGLGSSWSRFFSS